MIILENTKTGEQKMVQGSVRFKPPWKVKGSVMAQKKNEAAAQIAVLASRLGIPTSKFLAGARWLLGMKCPYCQVGGEFLALLELGTISEGEATMLVQQALDAKDRNDTEALEQLKGKLKSL